MKTPLQTALFLFVFSVVTVSAQRINPATGLPDDGSPLPKIDPATGLRESNVYELWQKAKSLMNQGQYEDSLQALQSYFERSRFDSDQAGGRLFSLLDWFELGRRYPKAKQALFQLRDADAQTLLKGEGDSIYFAEVNCINQDFGNGEASYTLFKAIEQRQPQLAGQCYAYVEGQLVQKGEYETCRKYIGDPESGFQTDCYLYQMEARNQAVHDAITQDVARRTTALARQHGWTNIPTFTSPNLSAMPRNHFVGQVRQLIEILVATGDRAGAEKIQHEALAVLSDSRLETAMADADDKIIHPINVGGADPTPLPAKQN